MKISKKVSWFSFWLVFILTGCLQSQTKQATEISETSNIYFQSCQGFLVLDEIAQSSRSGFWYASLSNPKLLEQESQAFDYIMGNADSDIQASHFENKENWYRTTDRVYAIDELNSHYRYITSRITLKVYHAMCRSDTESLKIILQDLMAYKDIIRPLFEENMIRRKESPDPRRIPVPYYKNYAVTHYLTTEIQLSLLGTLSKNEQTDLLEALFTKAKEFESPYLQDNPYHGLLESRILFELAITKGDRAMFYDGLKTNTISLEYFESDSHLKWYGNRKKRNFFSDQDLSDQMPFVKAGLHFFKNQSKLKAVKKYPEWFNLEPELPFYDFNQPEKSKAGIAHIMRVKEILAEMEATHEAFGLDIRFEDAPLVWAAEQSLMAEIYTWAALQTPREFVISPENKIEACKARNIKMIVNRAFPYAEFSNQVKSMCPKSESTIQPK